MIRPTVDVLHQGSCLCGWTIGYDPRTYDAAMDAAHTHVAEAYIASLSA